MLLKNLITPRLYFRPLQEEDQLELRHFFSNSAATQFITVLKNPAHHALARIKAQQERYAKSGDGLQALIAQDGEAFVGIAGLVWQEVDGVRELEIGYHLQPESWGQGYATEAAAACRDWVFQHTDQERLISIIDVRNLASQRVADRNGLKREKQIVWRNTAVYIYTITKKEWRSLD